MSSHREPATGDRRSPVQIWYTRSPLPTASGIAANQQFLRLVFASLGIAVGSIRTSNDSAVRYAHFTHLQPNLFREGGPVAPIWARSLGRETTLIGITRTDETQAILVKRDSKLRTLSDLGGRKLALPRHQTRYADHARAHALFGYDRILHSTGLSLGDVTLVDVIEDEFEIREPPGAGAPASSRTVLALRDGTVDAIYSAGPRVRNFMAKHGFRPLGKDDASPISDETTVLGTPRAVTVNRELARRHPEVAAEYLALMLWTAEWAVREPMSARSALCADLGLSELELLAGYGSNVHRQLAVHLDSDPVMALEEQKVFLLHHGFIQDDFDFAGWVDPTPLKMAHEMLREGSHAFTRSKVPA